MLLTLLLGLLQLVPQELPIPQVIDTQDGLSNSIIYDVYQDRQGFVWIATDNGLNRFDGYEFKVFYHNRKDSTSISSNTVRSILEDRDGNLWVGTFDGLNRYNPDTENFSRFRALPDIPDSRLDIQSMAFDSQGTLWFNTLRTIGWFDINNSKFDFIDPTYLAYSMALDDEDRIWTSSKTGSFDQFLPKEKRIKLIGQREAPSTPQLYWGPHSKSLWIESKEFQNVYGIKTSLIPELPQDAFARELLETYETTLWIGTEIGLFVYYKDSDQLRPVSLGSASTLSSAIRSIYEDNNGGVWVGTLNGLFHFDPFQKPFEHIDVLDGAGDVVMGLKNSKNGLFANTLGKGLYRYDSTTKAFKEKSFREAPTGRYNFIWDIEFIDESEYQLWLATDAGLLLYNPNNGKWKNANLPMGSNGLALSFSIYPTSDEFVWVSSQRGIHQLLRTDGSINNTIYLSDQVKESIIQDIEVIDDRIFIATEGEGIFVYNTSSKSIQSLVDIVPKSENIATISIWELYADGKSLWIGTNRGLYQLQLNTNSFKQIQAGLTLENRIIFSLEKDASGNLWMGTGKGLVSYHPDTENIRYFDINDGLKNVEFNRKSVTKTVDGRLLFGGVNGITSFNPSLIRQNKVVPSIHISDINIITSDSTFTPSLYKTGKLKLPWQQNTIEIDYVALNYTNSSQNQYRHQLKGYDPGWVENKGARQARYVRLPPGEYTFEVMGSNNDGLWNPDAKSITIEILPPFWQTWWFKSLIVLSVTLILWGIYKYRVRRLLEVERIRLRIAGDLHDEVGSGLSGIALTGDLLQRQVKNGGAKPELVERITKNARNLASALDAIVWLIDPKKETLGDFLIKTRAIAGELLTQSKFEMIEELTETDRHRALGAEQKRHLFLLTKEGLHNIAKHAKANNVTLTVAYSHSKVNIKLVDDGVGFDPRQNEKGHGLGSMRNRADLLKSQLEFHSSIGKGTQISLSIKLP